MDNTELILPSLNSHWSVRFVDIKKPFPGALLTNMAYKVIRFLYPPFALEAVDIVPEVRNPELSILNLGISLGCSLIATGLAYALYKYLQQDKPKPPQSTVRLPQLRVLPKADSGSVKLGDLEKKAIADQALLTSKVWSVALKDCSSLSPQQDKPKTPQSAVHLLQLRFPPKADSDSEKLGSLEKKDKSDQGNLDLSCRISKVALKANCLPKPSKDNVPLNNDDLAADKPDDLAADKPDDLDQKINGAVWERTISKMPVNP